MTIDFNAKWKIKTYFDRGLEFPRDLEKAVDFDDITIDWSGELPVARAGNRSVTLYPNEMELKPGDLPYDVFYLINDDYFIHYNPGTSGRVFPG